MLRKLLNSWRSVRAFIRNFLEAYGGFTSLVTSPYLLISIVVTALNYGIWSREDWWDIVINVVPSMLGFTLGAFGLACAFTPGKYGAILSKARLYDEIEIKAPLMKVAAHFVHFLMIQAACVLFAITAKAFNSVPPPKCLSFLSDDWVRHSFWACGWFLLIYAIFSVLSTSQWLFSLFFSLVKFNKKEFKNNLSDRS